MYSPKSVASDSILSTLKHDEKYEPQSDESSITQHSDCIAAISRQSKRLSHTISKRKTYSPRLLSIIKRQASVTNDLAIMALRQANGDVADAIFNLTYSYPPRSSTASVASNMEPLQNYEYLSSSSGHADSESGSVYNSSTPTSSKSPSNTKSVLSDTPSITASPSKSNSKSNSVSNSSCGYVQVTSSSKEDSVMIETHPSYRDVIDSLPTPSALVEDINDEDSKDSMESLSLPPNMSTCTYPMNGTKEIGVQTNRERKSTRRFERGLINAVIGHIDLALHEFETSVIQLQLKEHRILSRMSKGKRELNKSIANMMNGMLLEMRNIKQTQEQNQWKTQMIIFLWPIILLFACHLFECDWYQNWPILCCVVCCCWTVFCSLA